MARRVNLLPPALEARRKQRQTAASLVAAGMAVVVLLGAIFVVQELRLRGERKTLEDQEAINAGLRAQVARLAEFEELERETANRIDLLTTLTEDEVRWSGILADISLAIPSNVWLTSFTGAIAEGAAADPAAAEDPAVGDIAMQGTTFEHVDVARWLTRLADVKAFFFPYISLSAKKLLFDEEVVDFSSTVRLTDESLRANQRGGQRRL